MNFTQRLEKILTKFGENNSPAVVAMGIAAAKGFFRPLFTMTDKKESYETKRYTATREGLTELVAIPVYYLSGLVADYISNKLADKKYFMSKKMYAKYIFGGQSEDICNAVNRAEKLAQENLPKLKSTTAFIGVCVSALFIIPFVCSLTIKPIMNKIENSKKPNCRLNLETTLNKNMIKQQPLKSYYPVSNGMKVGGL